VIVDHQTTADTIYLIDITYFIERTHFPQFILQVKKFNASKVKWATSHHRWAVECGRFGLSWLFPISTWPQAAKTWS